MLNNLGFAWTLPHNSRDARSVDTSSIKWRHKFEQLKTYKSKHGDCNVKWDDENQSLAYWVQKQRLQYKQLILSEERVNMLDSVGFNWDGSKEKLWWDKYEELKLYKSKYGHCNVPQTYNNQPLANWVQRQRAQFKQKKMSEERVNMLNAVGFRWSARKKLKRYDDTWNDKYEALKQYKLRYGDCEVPQTYKPNQLGGWVARQRMHFKKMLKGLPTTLTKERIELLESIGFVWSMMKNQLPTSNETSEKRIKYHLVGNDINTNEKESKIGQNHEKINTYNGVTPLQNETQKRKEEFEPIAGNKIDTELEDSHSEQNHDQIVIETSHQNQIYTEQEDCERAIEPSYQDSKRKRKLTESSRRTLHDKVQVLCKLSIMFQEQKDVIYADMKRRKLDNIAN